MKRVSLLAVVLLLAATALAGPPEVVIDPEVELSIVVDGAGNFELFADCTGGDANGGLAGYNLVLENYISATNTAPKYVLSVIYTPGGFVQGPLTDVYNSPDLIFDGQTPSGFIIYNVGVTPLAPPTSPPLPYPTLMTRGYPVGMPARLAVGTYDVGGPLPRVDLDSSTATCWFAEDDNDARWATLTPEPATLALLGLGGLAILRRRR